MICRNCATFKVPGGAGLPSYLLDSVVVFLSFGKGLSYFSTTDACHGRLTLQIHQIHITLSITNNQAHVDLTNGMTLNLFIPSEVMYHQISHDKHRFIIF